MFDTIARGFSDLHTWMACVGLVVTQRVGCPKVGAADSKLDDYAAKDANSLLICEIFVQVTNWYICVP